MSPDQALTVPEMLTARAAAQPEATAYSFGGRRRTYRQVWEAAGRAAGHLAAVGVGPGDNVLIGLPNGDGFFEAFYGTLRSGGTAVPVYPGLGAGPMVATARRCHARLIVHAGEAASSAELAALAGDAGFRVATPSDWAEAPVAAPADRHPNDVAFIQYTSGSTGEPQGVQITHDNLLTNIRQLIAGMAITPADRFVSWLPTYHDMGLILMTMVPFYLGIELHLLPTSLRNVGAWLGTIARTRGTVTAAPDFAYRLCVRSGAIADVSSLRMALNAAEMVRASTIADFERAFGLSGVMVAGYGLAEATVGVTTWPPGTTPRVDERGFVSVGPPFPGVEIRIVGDSGTAGPGVVGEILVASIARAAGYYEAPAATAEAFGADGYIRTGDLGYLDGDGNLYIVGRKKNIIIVAGRNVAPHEIAQIVDARPEVRLSAAVGIDRGGLGGEQAHVFAEVRTPDLSVDDLHALAVGIAADVWDALGLRAARVHLVEPGTIPLTSNGKVRHGVLRDRYLDGTLAARGALLSAPVIAHRGDKP